MAVRHTRKHAVRKMSYARDHFPVRTRIRRVCRLALSGIFILTTAGLNAAGPADDGKDREQPNTVTKRTTPTLAAERNERRSIADLIHAAYGLPPEFSADTLIKIADNAPGLSASKRVRLLEDAFQLARGVQAAFRRESFPGASVDTRSGYLDVAYAQGFDSVSLQSRIVESMTRVERRRAVELFSQLRGLIQMPTVKCSELLTYNVDEYYRALLSVLQNAFTPAQLKAKEHLRLLNDNITALSSAVQVGPLAKTIGALQLEDDDLSAAIALFGGRLSSLNADPLSFSVVNRSMLQHVGGLARVASQRKVVNAALLSGLRDYIRTNAYGPQCGPADARERVQRSLDDVGEQFRSMASSLSYPSDSTIDALPKAALKVGDLNPVGVAEAYWSTPDSQKLLAGVQHLNEKRPKVPDTSSELFRAEQDVLAAIVGWSGSTEKYAADYLHQKAVLLQTLCRSAAFRQTRDDAFEVYASFLELRDADAPRMEWFMHVRELLKSSGLGEDGHSARLLKSKNSVIAMYARLQQLKFPAE